jgi:hypothetical protein
LGFFLHGLWLFRLLLCVGTDDCRCKIIIPDDDKNKNPIQAAKIAQGTNTRVPNPRLRNSCINPDNSKKELQATATTQQKKTTEAQQSVIVTDSVPELR